MDRRKVDVIVSAVLIVVSLIILTNENLVEGGVETDLGSMFLPRIVAILILIFSATIGIQSFLKLSRRAKIEEQEIIATGGFLGVNIYIGIFIAYWFVVPYVGFLVATPFVMFSIAVLLGGRNWIPTTLLSIILPILIFYGCNHFLRVFLPTWSIT